MSISRINYTGRERIRRESVSVGITGNPPAATVAANFALEDYGFPGTSRVVLEAYAGWLVQRFEFGTVDTIAPPVDPRLTEFDSVSGLLFRLKIIGVGADEGRILGAADQIHPSADFDAASQQSFVVVRPQDLGDRVWKLELDVSQPVLLVNNRIADHHDFLKRRDVAALVLPEVLAQLLRFSVETEEEDGADGTSWVSMTRRIGMALAGRVNPPEGEEEELQRWVDEAVGAFSRRHSFMDAFSGTELGAER